MKINKDNIPIVMQSPDSIMRNITGYGGMTIAFNEIPKGTDFTPLLEGLKNNSCHCPHWGYIVQGVIRIIYDDKSEEVVYDNQLGEEDNSDPTTQIGGGAIVVHSRTKSKSESDKTLVDDTILIYPNPVSSSLNIESDLSLTKVEIYSFLGQTVKEVNADLNLIDLGDLSNGIYMIKIHSENGSTVRKLIKQ